jgi:branched-chain amino acid transport system ATP-binding protein
MADPKLLLLDEPSIGLSPNLVQDILQTVRKLADESGLFAILVEQNVKVALDVADYVLALRGGKVIFEGKASEISIDKLWDFF